MQPSPSDRLEGPSKRRRLRHKPSKANTVADTIYQQASQTRRASIDNHANTHKATSTRDVQMQDSGRNKPHPHRQSPSTTQTEDTQANTQRCFTGHRQARSRARVTRVPNSAAAESATTEQDTATAECCKPQATSMKQLSLLDLQLSQLHLTLIYPLPA